MEIIVEGLKGCFEDLEPGSFGGKVCIEGSSGFMYIDRHIV